MDQHANKKNKATQQCFLINFKQNQSMSSYQKFTTINKEKIYVSMKMFYVQILNS